MNSIMNLEDTVSKLKTEDKKLFKLFKDIYHISSATGTMKIPSTFRKKVRLYFGNKDEQGNIIESEEEVIKRIKDQKVVKSYNKWTGEGSIFNSLRASRPGMRPEELDTEKKKVEEFIQKPKEGCDFCDPEKFTPEDVFGRVKGEHCITGANIAKYDAWSSMIFFKRHNPLEFSYDELSDYIDTGFKWFEKVISYDREFRFPFLIWNCLQKAGASQVHGHAQVLITNEIPYAKAEFSRRYFQQYMDHTGTNFFEDMYRVHEGLELTLTGEVKGFASITPVKEKEFVIISRDSPAESNEVKRAVYKVLRSYIDKLGVTSFNLVISCPTADEVNFMYVIKIVDRGNVFKPTADIGAMELYGSSVIADDPYNVIKAVNEF